MAEHQTVVNRSGRRVPVSEQMRRVWVWEYLQVVETDVPALGPVRLLVARQGPPLVRLGWEVSKRLIRREKQSESEVRLQVGRSSRAQPRNLHRSPPALLRADRAELKASEAGPSGHPKRAKLVLSHDIRCPRHYLHLGDHTRS